jgi:protein SCO1/2
MKSLLIFVLLSSYAGAQSQVQTGWRPTVLKAVGIEQHLGAQVPLDIPFADESGKSVTLQKYAERPIILALVYYQCPSLCNMVLNGVLRSVRNLGLSAGEDFDIVAVSFDPRETSEMAMAKKASYMKGYDRAGADRGWHFLTGPAASTKCLADTVGFHFAYDALTNQFAHGSAIMILTPGGRVARYFFGIDFPARDVRLSLEEASGGSIGSPIDAVLLYCYHYDPSNGKYGMVVMNVLRLAGLVTVAALAILLLVMFRRDLKVT